MLRRKTGATVKVPILMVDATDGYSEEVSVTAPTIYISKNGAAEAAPNDGAWAEIDATNMPGQYTMQLDATDTNTVGTIQGIVTKTGCRNFHFTVEVYDNIEQDIYNQTNSGTYGLSALKTLIDVIDGIVDAILVDTGTDIPATLTTIDDYIDTEVAAIKAKTDLIPAAPATEAKQDTIIGYIDTEVASILAAVDTEVAAIKAKTDNLPASPANEATLTTIAGYLDTEIAAILEDTGTTLPATLAAIAAYIDTEVAAILEDTGTTLPALIAALPQDKTGYALSAAGITEIWHLLLTGITTAGSIGKLIKDYLDAAITSRLADADYTAPDNTTIIAIAGYIDTEVAAIKAKTDNLPASPAATSDIPTADITAILEDTSTTIPAAIAALPQDKTGYSLSASAIDAIWDEVASGHTTSGSFGKFLEELRKLSKNKIEVTESTFKVYDDDGVTVLWTQSLSDDSTTVTKGAAG